MLRNAKRPAGRRTIRDASATTTAWGSKPMMVQVQRRRPPARQCGSGDHEEEADEGEPPSEDNLAFKAPDWPSFLESLQLL